MLDSAVGTGHDTTVNMMDRILCPHRADILLGKDRQLMTPVGLQLWAGGAGTCGNVCGETLSLEDWRISTSSSPEIPLAF